jgi:mannose-6-phosphate isomerase-like protein (cupin superfamily)
MDPFILTKKAGSEVTPVFQHEGQEMMYVIEGTMKFCHGTKEFIVEEGDCVYYDASLPHGGTVIGDRDLKCLVVIYTPET